MDLWYCSVVMVIHCMHRRAYHHHQLCSNLTANTSRALDSVKVWDSTSFVESAYVARTDNRFAATGKHHEFASSTGCCCCFGWTPQHIYASDVLNTIYARMNVALRTCIESVCFVNKTETAPPSSHAARVSGRGSRIQPTRYTKEPRRG